MGKTTSVLANHDLDVSSLENLAADLSRRLHATIVYGYNKTYFLTERKEVESDYEFIEMGIIEIQDATSRYILTDENYGAQLFIEKFGLGVLEDKNIIIDDYIKECIVNENDAIEFELVETIGDSAQTTANIYAKTVDFWTTDFLHWYSFQRMFIYKMEGDDLDYLNKWRTDNLKWITLFGGNYMFVFSYEEESYRIQELLQNTPLHQSLQAIIENFPDTLVPVSNYIYSKSYRQKPLYEQSYNTMESLSKHLYAIENKIDFFPHKIVYPILFYDDFTDLDATINKTKYFDFVYNGNFIFDGLKKQEQFEKEFKIKRKKISLPDLTDYFKLYDCFIAGYKYHYSISLQTNLILNQEVFLTREKDNKFDKHAIALYIDYHYEGETNRIQLGYIPKHENYMLSKLLDNGYSFKAFLTMINSKEFNLSNFNYALKVSFYFIKG